MYYHLTIGSNEWKHTATVLQDQQKYWAHTFESIADILEVTHKTQPHADNNHITSAKRQMAFNSNLKQNNLQCQETDGF